MKTLVIYLLLCVGLFAQATKVGGSGTSKVGGSGTSKVTGVVAAGPVSISALTEGNDSDGTSSATTASVSPGSNKLLLLSVSSFRGDSTDPAAPTVTGNGLTWVQVATTLYDSTSSSRRRVSLFRALGASPSAGVITIDFAGANQGVIQWLLSECSNVDTSGTNGSGAVVQSAATNSGGSPAGTTLAAFGSANNATYFTAGWLGVVTSTAGTGFGNLEEIQDAAQITTSSEFRNDNDTTPDMTCSPSASNGGIGIEIKRI